MTLLRRLLATLALLVAIAVVGGTPANGQSTSRVPLRIAAKRLGGLWVNPSSPSYRRAVRYFAGHGQAGSTSRTRDFCYLRFTRIGLSVTFTNRGLDRATLDKCTFFEADATSKKWHTPNGLHVGATAATMMHRFPNAREIGEVGGVIGARLHHPTEWWLAHWRSQNEEARTILVADVRRGHVLALGISVVGH